MANGDTFLVGVTQPPNNRATSATLLIHNGSAFGTQHTAFWVQRLGAPLCSAAIRGDNFSTAPPGAMPAGVLGMAGAANSAGGGIGVLGSTSGRPGEWDGRIGVMGIANSFGVIGRSLIGLAGNEQGDSGTGTGVIGQCDAGVGVHGSATSGWGVIGQSIERAGVTGKSVTGVGIEAQSEQSHGLQAMAQSGDGVLGTSRDAIGVEGITEQGLAGVRGRSNSGQGVLGESNAAAGVHGRSISGHGVFGESDQAGGVVGVSPTNAVQGWSTGTGGGSIGVTGWSSDGAGVQGDSDTGIGVCGRSPNGLAAYFKGNVVVDGSFSVVGGSKSAAVRHPDGTHRLLFALESPESYFEDFGEVTLTGASVVVSLDKDFAALVKRNKYQVFLTSYGPEALYVLKRGPESFEIARVNDSTGVKLRKVQVGYRIVAPRADLKSARLPKTKISPQVTEVIKPDLVSGNARRKRVEALTPVVKLDPLPAIPRIPALDLKALAEAKPVEAEGKGSG